jgi:hypothetical protein
VLDDAVAEAAASPPTPPLVPFGEEEVPVKPGVPGNPVTVTVSASTGT